MSTPQPLLDFREILGPQHSAAHALQAVDQPRQSNGCWVLDKHVHMVIFTIELNELGCKVLAYTAASRSNSLDRSLRQNVSAVLCYKYQMNMKETYYGPSSSVVSAFPVACHSKTKYSGVMQRLQAFKYELIADGAQNRSMRQFAGACRFVYNRFVRAICG